MNIELESIQETVVVSCSEILSLILPALIEETMVVNAVGVSSTTQSQVQFLGL